VIDKSNGARKIQEDAINHVVLEPVQFEARPKFVRNAGLARSRFALHRYCQFLNVVGKIAVVPNVSDEGIYDQVVPGNQLLIQGVELLNHTP
jgi:hypothetical protein